MDTPVNLSMYLKSPHGHQSRIEIRGAIPQSDWDTLQDYRRFADELEEIRFSGNPLDSALNVSWKQGNSAQVATRLPSPEDLCLLLHKLRRLILERERTSFPRVRAIVGRWLNQDLIHEWLKEMQWRYSGRRIQEMIQVRSNDVLLNCEKTLQMWLNGYHYHGDIDKRRAFDELHWMLPREATEAFFVQMLREKVLAIHELRGLVRLLNTPHARMSLTLRQPLSR